MKRLYLKNKEKNGEKRPEIRFIFEPDRKESPGEKNTANIRLTSLDEFYSLLEKEKHLLASDRGYIFEASSKSGSKLMLKAYQLLSFLLFYQCSKERLSQKMDAFNQRICNQSEKHIAENILEFARMNRNGKLIRGTLVNLGYYMASESVEYSDDLALAFEAYQTALLIQDDIIDHAGMRRNQPTIPLHYLDKWKKNGIKQEAENHDIAVSMAMCSGDIGMCFANQTLIDAYEHSKCFGAMLRYFNQVICKTIQGEIIDVILPLEERNYHLNQDALTESILEIYRLKTAWYTTIGPLCTGAILAGAAKQELKALEEFAQNLGIAFQIKDDILDIYAEEALGKHIGSDIKEFKQTLLYAYVRDQEKYFKRLVQYYGKEDLTPEDLREVQELFDKSGALKYAEGEMDKYFARAAESLKKMKFIRKDKRALLLGLIWYLQMRSR